MHAAPAAQKKGGIMKFTEGYWLRSERAQISYVSQGFDVETSAQGMRIIAPERPIRSRADMLDLTVLLMDFIAVGPDDIEVVITHHEGYDSAEPRFPLNFRPVKPEITVTDEEAVMTAGRLTVRVDRATGSYRFEAGGRPLTGAGFRNTGYVRWDKLPSSMRPGYNYFKADYEPYVFAELSLKPGETVYGLGERFTPFVKNGQTVDLWNEDGGTASDVSYKNIPFYMTSENYGVFIDHSAHVSLEVGSEKVEYVNFTVPGEQLRYHLLYGETPAEIMENYTALTGRPALPPAWSFGLWLSTSFKPDYDEKTTGKLIDGMQERGIPFKVFHFDCFWMRGLHWCDFVWDESFGNVKAMLKRYHKKGLKICCWINPYVAQNTEMFDEGMIHGYFLQRADGRGVKQVDNWQPGLAVVDFTNPDACLWYADKLKKLLSLGVDCLKTDFGERIPTDVVYYDGSDPEAMHNYYTYLYNRLVFETLREEKKEAVLFARSATALCQQFPVHWGGDCFASYASMAESLRGGLSFAMSGFAFWSHDISGFESTATPDLYKRWVQFGLLSTHSRLHGSDTYRVPWVFDEESCEVLRTFSEWKCRLMPYLYRMAVIAHEKGTPMLRPMAFEFPNDPACKYLDMQYMLGESLLVAPIFNEEGRVSFYLPAGRWKNLLDGEILEGGRFYERTYDYFHLPLFVRGGSILAVGACDQQPDYDYAEGVTLHCFLPENGQETVCEIPDTEGKTVFTVKARVKDGALYLISSDPGEGRQVVIHELDGTERHGRLSSKKLRIPLKSAAE